MNMGLLGNTLVIIVAMYFLFQLGKSLAEGNFQDPRRVKSAWMWVAILAVLGWVYLDENNWMGLMGLIPIYSYMTIKIVSSTSFGSETQKRVQAGVFAVFTSSAMYAITHAVLGFGVTEASLSSLFTAIVLALLGYSA